MWKFLVKQQKIEIIEREVIADHQIAFVNLKFTFDGDWKKFHKVVQFSQCDEVYSLVLGFDGTSCKLPAELHAGAVQMSVFGYDAESDTTVRATTVPITLNIRHSGFVGDDDTPIPPTPDLYTQLLQKIAEIQAGVNGKDGLSAYEIAVKNGFVGTVSEWLESLKGADGLPGKDGINGTDGHDGTDGRDGTDGKDGITPDMSEYPKTSDVTTIIERKIAPVAAESHSHDNKETLDSMTPELFADLNGLQQFEDSTKYDIQTLNEAMDNLRQGQHTHENKAVLDTITEQYMRDQTAFQASTANALHGLSTGLSEVSAQAHSHGNRAALDKITEELITTMQEYEPFEDWTREQIHTLFEMVNNYSNTAHTHENKAALDRITQEILDDMSSISTVVGQAHWHHNLTTLNGITESHVTRWNETYVDAQNLKERVDVNEGVFERFKTEILYDMQGAKKSITEHNARLSALETALSGVETALADIVEVSE